MSEIELEKARRHADATGGPMLVAFAALVVGGYRFATIGAHWSAIVMVAGAVATWLAVAAYLRAVEARPGRSWGKAAASASILLPWAFSLYLMGYEGAYRACQGIAGAGVGAIVTGLLWVVGGWWLLYKLGALQSR